MALGTLTIDIGANLARLESDMGRANRLLEKSAQDAKRRAQIVGGAVGNIIGAVVGGAVGQRILQNTIDAGREMAQLEATLKSTRGAAGLTKDELVGMAGAMKQLAMGDDGAIVGAESILLTYTTIGKETFPRALEAALDMSAALGKDLSASAEQVGRALGSPTKAMAALSKQGFVFTKDQQAALKAMEDTGQVAEAQAFILDQLEEAYGGSAAAARDTLGGALQSLGNTMNDLFEGDQSSAGQAKVALDEVNGMIQEFASDAAVTDKIGKGLAVTFKSLATGVIVLSTGFDIVGSSIGAAAAALAAIARGDFAGALEIRNSSSVDNLNAYNVAAERLAKLWSGEYAPAANEAASAGGRLRTELNFGLVASEESAKKAKKASDAIQKQVETLQLQAATLGQTSLQAELYKLKTEGATEAQLVSAEAALRAVGAYEQYQKTLESAAQAEDDMLSRWSSSDQSYWTKQEQALAKYQERLGVLGEQQLYGGMDDAEFQKQQSRAWKAYQDDLKDASGATFDWAEASKEAARSVQSSFADFLFDPFAEGVDGMLVGFLKVLQRMAAEAAASQIFQAVGNSSAWGSLMGMVGTGVSSYFGGAGSGSTAAGYSGSGMSNWISGQRASGGPTAANSLYQVNERGPELYSERGRTYLMTGSQGGSVTPLGSSDASALMASGGGSPSIVIHTEVHVAADGAATTSSDSGTANDAGRQLGNMISNGARQVVQQELRPGGAIWRQMNGRA